MRSPVFKFVLFFLLIGFIQKGFTQEWEDYPIPVKLENGESWQLNLKASDDFNYKLNASNKKQTFGKGRWYNFYHNQWDGPGTTYWKYNHISVDGDNLMLRASRWDQKNEPAPKTGYPNKMNRPKGGINAGCVSSNYKVKYPVFVEANVSVADIVLASDVWLLSPDDTQEIDIMECYGGGEQGNEYFSKFIHLSHHSFIRKPFQDYQPRDTNSWWGKSSVTEWGDYSWNNGNRKYVRIGVYWASPFHFEYYIDGQLVRVLYDKAVATLVDGIWNYNYPTMTKDKLDFMPNSGYQKMTEFATSESFSYTTLKEASNTSKVSVIDPYNFQNGKGFTKEMDIIINMESQDWHVYDGRTPTDAQLEYSPRATMKVDWIRTYNLASK